MQDYTKACPYCGQVNLSGEDARTLCGCFGGVKYRKILSALEAVGGKDSPISEIQPALMETMGEIAHQIAAGQVLAAALKLVDGTEVRIGAKVKRTEKVELEEKI